MKRVLDVRDEDKGSRWACIEIRASSDLNWKNIEEPGGSSAALTWTTWTYSFKFLDSRSSDDAEVSVWCGPVLRLIWRLLIYERVRVPTFFRPGLVRYPYPYLQHLLEAFRPGLLCTAFISVSANVLEAIWVVSCQSSFPLPSSSSSFSLSSAGATNPASISIFLPC